MLEAECFNLDSEGHLQRFSCLLFCGPCGSNSACYVTCWTKIAITIYQISSVKWTILIGKEETTNMHLCICKIFYLFMPALNKNPMSCFISPSMSLAKRNGVYSMKHCRTVTHPWCLRGFKGINVKEQMAWRSRALVVSEDLGSVPSTTWWLIIVSTSSSRRLDTLLISVILCAYDAHM